MTNYNYVPSLPDCEKWKKLISEIAKGRSDTTTDSYVKSDSPLTEIKVVSHAAGDIAKAKSRLKKYKGKKSKCKSQRSSNSRRGKRSKQGKKKRISNKSINIKKI
jgi:hypothetical protein